LITFILIRCILLKQINKILYIYFQYFFTLDVLILQRGSNNMSCMLTLISYELIGLWKRVPHAYESARSLSKLPNVINPVTSRYFFKFQSRAAATPWPRYQLLNVFFQVAVRSVIMATGSSFMAGKVALWKVFLRVRQVSHQLVIFIIIMLMALAVIY